MVEGNEVRWNVGGGWKGVTKTGVKLLYGIPKIPSLCTPLTSFPRTHRCRHHFQSSIAREGTQPRAQSHVGHCSSMEQCTKLLVTYDYVSMLSVTGKSERGPLIPQKKGVRFSRREGVPDLPG